MDNEKEISFGAFDSELMHQEIFIPEGFTATIDGNKIILKKIESEDEKIRKRLIEFFEDWHKNRSHCWGISVPEILAWLEKQGTYTKKDVDDAYVEGMVFAKNELEKQGEQKPTDEDMKEALRTEYEKGRADAFAQMQKEWSEEDEVKMNRIVACLENLNVADNDILLKDVDWLKSIKDRVKSQNTWKPSDGQMSALKIATHCPDLGLSRVLKTLYNDLDKLTKE